METIGTENNNNISYIDDPAHHVKLLFTSFEIRVLNLLIGLIAAYFIRHVIGISIPFQVFAAFYAWLLICAVYLLLLRPGTRRTRRFTDNIHFSYYIPGVICATVLFHYLGGAEWIAVFIYFFDLIYANVLMRRIRGALVTGAIILCYYSVLFLEYTGIIPRCVVFPLEGSAYDSFRYFLSTNVIIMGILFLLVSYSTGIFSKMKESREKRLMESRNRFEVKTRQLEEITQKLRKKVAENTYLKRAAAGYIESKENELESVKKDLEDQIETLRRTQKSMFFMIEDLNEMSAQLKDARDHLEDKVIERTDELLDISRKLHRSERLAFLGKLAGSVTHELRNPLAVIKNAAYFLKKKVIKIKDPKVSKYLDMIEKEVVLIDSIIDDIMGFAKTKIPDLESSDIKKIIENVVSSIKIPNLIKLEKQFKKVPDISVDKDQLMHALINIANNAIMAMNGNGTLVVRVFQQNDHVCIEIEDNGPGIPRDQRDLIFEPLYSSKPKGTGLGLPIAKMMVENQDGRIEFDSEVGEGTVFRIFLPITRK